LIATSVWMVCRTATGRWPTGRRSRLWWTSEDERMDERRAREDHGCLAVPPKMENYMQITISSSTETATGPSEYFTGTVYIDTVATPTEPSRLGAASVHFTPGARTAWHTHPNGQTIYVTEGVGLCQRCGGPIEVIRPGRPRVLRAWRGPLARRCPKPFHDSHRDARSRRPGQSRHVGRARQRRGVRCQAIHRAVTKRLLAGQVGSAPACYWLTGKEADA
jgi:hypothetical protein